MTEQQGPMMYIIIQNQKREVANKKKKVIILGMEFKSDEMELEKKQMTVRRWGVTVETLDKQPVDWSEDKLICIKNMVKMKRIK